MPVLLMPRGLRRTPILAGLLAAVACACVAGSGTSSPVTSPSPSPSAVAEVSGLCTGRTCTTVPDLTGMTAARARTALAGANLVVPGELTAQADGVTITAQSPGPGTPVSMGTPVSLTYGTPPAAAAVARTISPGDWAQIAKDPAAHIGARIVVFGEVTQFDPETGLPTFRADVDGVAHPTPTGYATDAFLTGTPDLFDGVAKQDLFRAEATVTRPYIYETALGGTTTVPTLEVTAITVTGTAG